MRLNLATAAPLLARYAVQGACVTDPRVLEKINEARQRLMERPQMWKGKVQRFLFCASKACVTLPREIETVEAATVCNRPMKMRSKWYDVLDSGPGSSGLCGGDAVIDRGDGYVTFADFDEPRNVKVYADVPEVSTARMLLQGFDENGNRVRTWDDRNSEYVDGEYVAISNETPAVSVTVFSVVDGIQKPETNGYIRVYSFTPGIPGVAFSDSTQVINWPGPDPAPGTLQWTGSVQSIAWTGAVESLDFILRIFEFDDTVAVEAFDINGVSIPGVTLDSDVFTPTSFRYNAIAEIVGSDPGAGPNGGTLWEYQPDGDPANVISAGRSVRKSGSETAFVVTYDETFGPNRRFEIGSNTTEFDVGASAVEMAFPDDGNLTLNISNLLGHEVAVTLTHILAPDWWAGVDGGYYVFRFTRTIVEAADSIPQVLSLLAIQHPDETHPSYRRYEVPALRRCTDETAADQQVIIMAKLRYLPVKRSTDFLVIENIGALKQMLLAINAEEKNEFDLAQKLEAKAEKILADELQNHIGDAATNNQPMQVQQDCWAAGDIPCIL